jgi:hypothetical protein
VRLGGCWSARLLAVHPFGVQVATIIGCLNADSIARSSIAFAASQASELLYSAVVILLIRNEEVADPRLFFALRLVLSFGTAVLGATIPGFLAVGWSGSGLTVRAGGALALFVVTYLYSPDLVTTQEKGGQTTINAPGGVAAGQINNSPINIGISSDELRRTVKIFSKQIAVSSEERAKAEAQASGRQGSRIPD